jgi:hypothetical protein
MFLKTNLVISIDWLKLNSVLKIHLYLTVLLVFNKTSKTAIFFLEKSLFRQINSILEMYKPFIRTMIASEMNLKYKQGTNASRQTLQTKLKSNQCFFVKLKCLVQNKEVCFALYFLRNFNKVFLYISAKMKCLLLKNLVLQLFWRIRAQIEMNNLQNLNCKIDNSEKGKWSFKYE